MRRSRCVPLCPLICCHALFAALLRWVRLLLQPPGGLCLLAHASAYLFVCGRIFLQAKPAAKKAAKKAESSSSDEESEEVGCALALWLMLWGVVWAEDSCRQKARLHGIE